MNIFMCLRSLRRNSPLILNLLNSVGVFLGTDLKALKTLAFRLSSFAFVLTTVVANFLLSRLISALMVLLRFLAARTLVANSETFCWIVFDLLLKAAPIGRLNRLAFLLRRIAVNFCRLGRLITILRFLLELIAANRVRKRLRTLAFFSLSNRTRRCARLVLRIKRSNRLASFPVLSRL